MVAQKPGSIPEVCYDYMGDLRGWEVLKVKMSTSNHLVILRYCERETLNLPRQNFSLQQRTCCRRNKTRISMHSFVHEIVGHPTEADRVLKLETAYAGRSWFSEISKTTSGGNGCITSVDCLFRPIHTWIWTLQV